MNQAWIDQYTVGTQLIGEASHLEAPKKSSKLSVSCGYCTPLA
jgi:hypothetical protein